MHILTLQIHSSLPLKRNAFFVQYGSSGVTSVPNTSFFGKNLKRVNSRANSSYKISPSKFKIVAEVDEEKQTEKDRWKGLVTDVSDDQQDITRGKGMVDTLFQAPMGAGTHDAVLSSYEYISAGLRQYQFDNNMNGYYIAPAFMDKLVVHIAKNFMNLPNIKVYFFGAIRARVYDDEVRQWISSVGVENIGKKLVNSREKLPEFEQPKMKLSKLLEYGNMLVQEQENVKRVQLSDKYLKEAALGDANEDAMKNGTFYGKAAQQVGIPVPEGCTDPKAANYDPTARSDDGSCAYN
ncbi:hypothetical protein CDL12_10274 [Handroanthus impetiginosus]|uniref:Ribulose bisphosphate carboxylase/oxygenase activase AAA helical domain-containing protein n=1 Tax=Handroanthus impetiginosus TaxID=429701 RepID=A0A2G9HHT3_9LAMI|nr:hypothetical protein CDL12_10274 [Handroanthus impetiginosus]